MVAPLNLPRVCICLFIAQGINKYKSHSHISNNNLLMSDSIVPILSSEEIIEKSNMPINEFIEIINHSLLLLNNISNSDLVNEKNSCSECYIPNRLTWPKLELVKIH